MSTNVLFALDPSSGAYRKRLYDQTIQWAMGFPRHDNVTDLCCPDFSCCYPELFIEDPKDRWLIFNSKYSRRIDR